jgi:hypothetical protein
VTAELVWGSLCLFFPWVVVARSSGLREACWPMSNSFQVKEFVGEVVTSRECPAPATGSETS